MAEVATGIYHLIPANMCAGRSAVVACLLATLQEGWQPAVFKSSRAERGELKNQSVEDFLDEDERAERAKASLQVQASVQNDWPDKYPCWDSAFGM